MTAHGEQGASQPVDLSKYALQILAEQDRPLFDDAVKAAEVGALRASYMMIWLACAESLKRRFREAQLSDHTAGKIVGIIENREKDHRSVDKFLLDQAQEYGFVSGAGHTILGQVYEMRCIYGHPYEEAPSPEKVIDAAAAVVELVLSKPVKLRHGYGKQLLRDLLEDGNYLDDHEPAVAEFARKVFPRLDEGIYVWLLDEYWEKLEEVSGDPSMGVFSRRGMWFCRAMLVDVGVKVFTHDEWHERSGRFPKTLMGVCSVADAFKGMGNPAQDALVGSILDESGTQASVLTHLERLNNEGALSERQQERFVEGVSGLDAGQIRTSGLTTKTCYARLIDAMKSHNWYTQNPAIDMVLANGPDQAAELTEEQQVDLGRNILQAGEGTATSAVKFLEKLPQEAVDWPFGVIRGMALESFTNENNEIRFKNSQLHLVLSALVHCNSVQRDELIAEIVASVAAGTPKHGVRPEDYDQVMGLLNDHPWTAPLAKALETELRAE